MTMKKFLKAVSSLFCSFLCINFICLFYYSGLGSIHRENGATTTVGIPGSWHINASEGLGIIRFDKNGYHNIDGELSNPYILIMGSSNVVATQLLQGRDMSAILNRLLGGSNEELKVYNIAHSGNYLPGIVKGFQAGILEFPNSCAIIIEVTQTSFSMSDLQESLQQTVYDSTSSGVYLTSHTTAAQRTRSLLIGALPFIKVMKHVQSGGMNPNWGTPFGLICTETKSEAECNRSEYAIILNNAFSLIRSEYNNPIILLYHPSVTLSNGGMKIVRDENTYDIFQGVCEDNNIIFLDTGDAFLEAYEDKYTIPYGFSNTEMCSGHLNTDGHEIVANELYRVLQDLQGAQIK